MGGLSGEAAKSTPGPRRRGDLNPPPHASRGYGKPLAPSAGVRPILEDSMPDSHDDAAADRFGAVARLLALGALIACTTAFDPFAGDSGVDSGLLMKRAALQGAAFLATILLLLGAIARGRLALALSPYDLLAAAFVTLGAVSASWARNGDDSIRDALMSCAAVVVMILVRTEVTVNGPWRAMAALVVGAVLAALADLVFLVAREETLSLEGAAKFGSRVFPHQNMAALAYGAPAALALVVALSKGPRARRVAYGIAVAVLAFALYLAGSKGALIGLVLGPLLFLGLERVRGGFERVAARLGTAVAGAGSIVIVAALGAGAVLLPRRPAVSAFLKEAFNRTIETFDLNYHAAYMRPELWKKTFLMFDDHPALGVGLGNFQYVIPAYDVSDPARPHAHNQVLQSLAELGLAGLLLIVLLLAVPCLAALWATRPAAAIAQGGDPAARTASRAVGCALLVFAFQSVFEPPLVLAFGAAIFFALAAIATASGRTVVLDVAARPLTRFAFLPACAAAIAIQWLPRSFVPLAQGEWTRAGLALEAKGDLDGARERYLAAAEGFDSHVLHQLLGGIEFRRRRFEPALNEFRRALATFPESWSLHLDAAKCLVELGRTSAALAALDRAEALRPGRGEIRFWRGRAHLAGGDLDLAIELLEAHRQGVAENTEILRYCADAYYARTRRDRSLADAQEAHERYSRYRALGGKGGDGWVRERIDELGHWLRHEAVLPEPGSAGTRGRNGEDR